MVAAGNAGEADHAGHSVCNPRDPATRAVAVSDDRRDRKSGHRVHGIKAARVKRVVCSIEEAIRVRAIARVFQRLLPAGNTLESQIERETIRESFRGKKRGGLRVGILFYETDRVNRCGNGCDECSGVHPAEDAVKAAEAARCPEVGSAVRVGSDECRRYAHAGDRRKPVLGFGQASRKEPNLLLIGDEIRWGKCEGRLRDQMQPRARVPVAARTRGRTPSQRIPGITPELPRLIGRTQETRKERGRMVDAESCGQHTVVNVCCAWPCRVFALDRRA